MQKRVFIIGGVAVLAASIGLNGFIGSGASENLTLETISGASLASDPKILLVDIRTPEEWKQTGVIEGALLVTYISPESFLAAITPKLASGQRLALICRSGSRSSRAAQQVAEMVDFPVVDIRGGMLRVLNEGYAPVTPTREMELR